MGSIGYAFIVCANNSNLPPTQSSKNTRNNFSLVPAQACTQFKELRSYAQAQYTCTVVQSSHSYTQGMRIHEDGFLTKSHYYYSVQSVIQFITWFAAPFLALRFGASYTKFNSYRSKTYYGYIFILVVHFVFVVITSSYIDCF